MNGKSDKALALLAQLSYIDDEHIAFADSYIAKKKRFELKPILAATVTAACVFATVSVLLFRHTDESYDTQNFHGVSSPTVASVLKKAEAEYSFTPAQKENIDTFEPCIVWQDSADGKFNVLSLSEDDIELLSTQMHIGAVAANGDEAESVKLWICNGNGETVTPYLQSSPGNIGIDFFDYEPELIPSESFVICLENIICERKTNQ